MEVSQGLGVSFPILCAVPLNGGGSLVVLQPPRRWYARRPSHLHPYNLLSRFHVASADGTRFLITPLNLFCLIFIQRKPDFPDFPSFFTPVIHLHLLHGNKLVQMTPPISNQLNFRIKALYGPANHAM